VVVLPSLVAYGLGLLFSLDPYAIRDTFPILLAALAYGTVIVLSAGTLMLALSSLSRNSRYIALFWVALWFVTTVVYGVLWAADTIQREIKYAQKMQVLQTEMMQQPPPEVDDANPAPPERKWGRRRGWDPEMHAKMEQIRKEHVAESLAANQSDWRPLVSYTGNIYRIGYQLFGMESVWRKLSDQQPPEMRDEVFLANIGPQYPWYWSAGVLTVLFGLSVCILNFRVRSLDRLK
jgi:hypothetical protein